ncbi:FIG004453: protein YceG like [hydrothermal vent metagenome]|uniref:FIG004453: protein YceG like n=1 Tax=hydrothermal vent metagenome TaxID=652676 RepID=A0A1W1D1D6_9ZZZZ
MLSSFHTKAIRIKIFAGENTEELTKRLANDLKLKQTKLLEAYKALRRHIEGDILSGFYFVSSTANEESIIHAIFAMSDKRLKAFTQRHCQAVPNVLEFKVLLTIASIIQKESNDPKEMPLISSVIENRLNKGMKLQMDSTLNYAKYSHKIITSSRIKNDESYYNTYKYKGIPPSPLCTVSIDALKSALYPRKTNYLYFMLNKKGKHDFSATYAKHKKNIRAFKEKVSPTKEHNNSKS